MDLRPTDEPMIAACAVIAAAAAFLHPIAAPAAPWIIHAWFPGLFAVALLRDRADFSGPQPATLSAMLIGMAMTLGAAAPGLGWLTGTAVARWLL